MVKGGKKTPKRKKQHGWSNAELDMTSPGHPLPTKLLLFKQVKTLKLSFETLKIAYDYCFGSKKGKEQFFHAL